MPRVEVVTEGDHLHELYIVLAGLVETFKPGVAETAEDISLNMEPGDPSYHGSMSRCMLLYASCSVLATVCMSACLFLLVTLSVCALTLSACLPACLPARLFLLLTFPVCALTVSACLPACLAGICICFVQGFCEQAVSSKHMLFTFLLYDSFITVYIILYHFQYIVYIYIRSGRRCVFSRLKSSRYNA